MKQVEDVNMQEKIGYAVKELREYKKISKEKFIKLLGIDETLLDEWESGTTEISSENLYKIACCLGVEIEYFFENPMESKYDCYVGSQPPLCILGMLYDTDSDAFMKKMNLRFLINEKVFNYIQLISNAHTSLQNTTEEQRERCIENCIGLLDEEFDEQIHKYIKGDLESSELENLCFEAIERVREDFVAEKDKKKGTQVWKAYFKLRDELDNSINNRYVDFRYAKDGLAVLQEYLQKGDSNTMYYKALQLVEEPLKEACETENEEQLREVFRFVTAYGNTLCEVI